MAEKVVVLGGGVGGTLCANLVARHAGSAAEVTLVDQTGLHVYQPGFLYVALGLENPAALSRPESRLLRHDVELVRDRAVQVDAGARQVGLGSGRTLPYDHLVIATGSRTAMEEIPGAEVAHEFYSMRGATRLHEALAAFDGGTILIGVAGIPYKCPPAPVEFAFLLDDHLRRRHIRERTSIRLLSPLNRALTLEETSKLVEPLLDRGDIELCTFFNVESVDGAARTVTSIEGETFAFDLLILVPPHRGQQVIEDSGLGDERGWIPVDRATLRHVSHERIWALGDATSIPISKSGSVAHFEAQVVARQIVAAVKGRPIPADAVYDGRVMCFVETGHGRATTIRFDYDHAPSSPRPARIWHWGKALMNMAYWHTVPQGRVPE